MNFPSASKVARTLGLDSKSATKIFKPGDIVDGRYEVVRCLGVGAMGSVFLVNHKRLNKPFALKMIIPDLALRKDFVARFEREAASCSKLSHPNCISVTDFGHNDDNNLYLVMEYVDGDQLSDVVRQGPVPIDEAIEYTLQILSGLEHAHSKGIIHRDIKMENVMRCRLDNGETLIKILDFGMAKAEVRAKDSPAITTKGLVMGTPQYMAPEQLRGNPVDARGDLYSVGITLFRLLTAKQVFPGEDMVDVLTAKLNQPAPTLAEISGKSWPEPLEEFLKKVLSREPAMRFSNARAMMHSLLLVREKIQGAMTGAGESAVNSVVDESSVPPRKTHTSHRAITLGDLFHRPLDDLVYWYTCGRNRKRASWPNRIRFLFRERVGKLVLIRFVFLSMFIALGGLTAVVLAKTDVVDSVQAVVSDLAGKSQGGAAPVAAPIEIEEKTSAKATKNADATDREVSVKSPSSAGRNQLVNVSGAGKAAPDVKPATEVQEREEVVASAQSASEAKDADVASLAESKKGAKHDTPAPLDDTLQAIERDIQRDRCTKSVEELENYLLTSDCNAAGGNYLLARAHKCVGKHKDTLDFYRNAIELEPAYRNDPILAEDVRQIVLSGRATDEALVFMKEAMGEAALPILIKFAGHAQRKSFRQKARETVAQMGAIDLVNLEASYDWDLNQAASCAEKREIVAKIAALGTQKAKMVLIRAKDKKERESLFRERNVHGCVRKDIVDAIASMKISE
ncbi:MAG: serine/threonine protein kinase [Deltaproteobacteria bacterium]|nr:serine/threonine protein kinase [Deltaproteobacteria bacterium]